MSPERADRTWDEEEGPDSTGPRPLTSLWGVTLLLGLLLYSVSNAMEAHRVEDGSGATALVSPTPVATSTPLPFRRAPIVVILSCDGEEGTSAVYDGAIPVNYVVLAKDADRDTIVELLEGRSTKFRRSARVQHTLCFQRALDAGAFP